MCVLLSKHNENKFDKIQYPFMIKKKQAINWKQKGNFPILIKGIYENSMRHLMWKTEHLSIKKRRVEGKDRKR